MKNLLILACTALLFIACGENGTTSPETNSSQELQSHTQPQENPTMNQPTPTKTKPDPVNNQPTPTKTQPDPVINQPDPIMIDPKENPQTDSLSKAQEKLLKAHNQARAQVGVNQHLAWSDAIAVDAQSYADNLANSGEWKHDPKNYTGYSNGPYGENLYSAYHSSGEIPSLETAAISWKDEKNFYHYDGMGASQTCDTGKVCGHYTQMIWKNTTEVGCATSRYKKGHYKDWYLIVCKYKTPGNYRGQKPY